MSKELMDRAWEVQVQPAEKLILLLAIAFLAAPDGITRTRVEVLARMARISTDKAATYIAELEADELLLQIESKDGLNTYVPIL